MDLHLLTLIAKGQNIEAALTKEHAIKTLATLKTSEAQRVLIELLDDHTVAQIAYEALSKNVYLFDAFYDVVDKHHNKNIWATKLLNDWAQKKWLKHQPSLPDSLTAVVFRVPFEVTAEMLSPLKAAWSRSDIVLHAKSFLKEHFPDAIQTIQALKTQGYPIAFVADQIDTQKARFTQRQSALESLLYHIGEPLSDLQKIHRGIVLSQQIDESFYELAENRGTLLLTLNTHALQMGDLIKIAPYEQKVITPNDECIPFEAKNPQWKSIWRAQSRTVFLLGNTLAHKAQLTLAQTDLNYTTPQKAEDLKGYTLAQKLIGKAAGLRGINPDIGCEVVVSTVALSAPLKTQQMAPDQITLDEGAADLVIDQHLNIEKNTQERVMLKPSDGKLTSWMNRLVLPDSVNISQEGSIHSSFGLNLSDMQDKAHESALTGSVSMRVPKSILIKFKGEKRSDIKLRDLINAISYFGLKENILFENNNKATANNPILEIEGLDFLTSEEAYEVIESAELYQMAGCTFQFDEKKVIQAVQQNITWLKTLLETRYSNHHSLKRRFEAMQTWLLSSQLLKRDDNAIYQKTLEISLEEIDEPLLASLQNPTQIFKLSELNQKTTPIDEVWVGSTAIHLDHYRVVAHLLKKQSGPLKTRLWLSPPSPLELKQLMKEGYYQIYGQAGVYTEMPEEAICTQSRFKPGSCIITTSLQTFSAQQKTLFHGYITSPEIATLTALLGRLPTLSEYRKMVAGL